MINLNAEQVAEIQLYIKRVTERLPIIKGHVAVKLEKLPGHAVMFEMEGASPKGGRPMFSSIVEVGKLVTRPVQTNPKIEDTHKR